MIREIHKKWKDILSRQIKMNDVIFTAGPSQFIDRVVPFPGLFVNSFSSHKTPASSFSNEYLTIFFSWPPLLDFPRQFGWFHDKYINFSLFFPFYPNPCVYYLALFPTLFLELGRLYINKCVKAEIEPDKVK